MAEFDSYIERDRFNEKIFDLVNEYLNNFEAYPDNVILAIQNKTNDLQIISPDEIGNDWDIYNITSLIRENDLRTGKEVDIDATYDLANKYFFVR